jgi:hypothetical protein
MIKVIDDTKTVMVNFVSESNQKITGKLLTYELCGDACVLVEEEKVWIPFSSLTKKCRKQILEKGPRLKNNTDINIFKEPKAVIMVTLLVMIFYTLAQ